MSAEEIKREDDNKSLNGKSIHRELTMDRINGERLDVYLKNLKKPENEQNEDYFKKIICLQLLYVVVYLNINGVYHNDLWGANIMIEMGNKLILDFLTLNNRKINIVYDGKDDIPIVKIIDFDITRLYEGKEKTFPKEHFVVDHIYNDLYGAELFRNDLDVGVLAFNDAPRKKSINEINPTIYHPVGKKTVKLELNDVYNQIINFFEKARDDKNTLKYITVEFDDQTQKEGGGEYPLYMDAKNKYLLLKQYH